MKVFIVTRHTKPRDYGEVRAVRLTEAEAQAFIDEQEAIEPIAVRYAHGEWQIDEFEMPLSPRVSEVVAP